MWFSTRPDLNWAVCFHDPPSSSSIIIRGSRSVSVGDVSRGRGSSSWGVNWCLIWIRTGCGFTCKKFGPCVVVDQGSVEAAGGGSCLLQPSLSWWYYSVPTSVQPIRASRGSSWKPKVNRRFRKRRKAGGGAKSAERPVETRDQSDWAMVALTLAWIGLGCDCVLTADWSLLISCSFSTSAPVPVISCFCGVVGCHGYLPADASLLWREELCSVDVVIFSLFAFQSYRRFL